MLAWLAKTNRILHPRHFHSRQPPGKARLGHGLEHLAHLRVLAQQIVDLRHGGPGAARDALAADPLMAS